MEVWYDVRGPGPDGLHYAKTIMKVPIDTKIGHFAARVAQGYSEFVPSVGATIFPPAGENLKALPLTDMVSAYDGKIGTNEAPFHVRLKQERASGKKCFRFG